ncbi:hypothetical protein EHS13_01920 [Paenibacillus psychroresistens]|uniref:Uncharacterized protein n=1 Tax=Paenibacillus psychroresistens TaxID=1778678 RepID=A0A6B8RC04_9BACL|nr:hypothetical protein [Paenibacillus psychroresistens]QGQ93750.1 hypothetical protein EHS13_01920 [Paenibacillus psychroresistens]
MEVNDKPAINGWWIIVSFLLLILFPVGLVLLLIRIIQHRNLSFKKIADLKVSAYALLAMYGVIIFFSQVGEIIDRKQNILGVASFSAALLIPAGFLFWLSKKRTKQLNDRYDSYYDIIIERKIKSIDQIAQMAGKREQMVKNDLQRMIYLGLLNNGFIDEISNSIVFYESSDEEEETYVEYEDETEDEAEVVQDKLFPKKVECAGCGSSSTLKPRETIFCTYCGASLVYPA